MKETVMKMFVIGTILFAAGTMSCLVGCDSSQRAGDACKAHGHGDADHAHAETAKGPHGGRLIELGDNEQYRAELLDNESKHMLTVYLLDTADKPVAINQGKIVVKLFEDGAFVDHELKAVGDTGSASEFSIVDEELVEHLDHSRGRLSVVIAGKEYVGVIEKHDHDHDDEGHDNSDDHDHDNHKH